MKINNIKNSYNSPSFGMKIAKTQGFDEFMQKARGNNWRCSEEDIQNFITELEDMHFANEDKEDTSIIFSPTRRELAGYRTFPSHTTGRKFVNQPCYIVLMPYTFYKTGDNAPRIADYAVPLNELSLNDILVNIAKDYAIYSYSNR